MIYFLEKGRRGGSWEILRRDTWFLGETERGSVVASRV